MPKTKQETQQEVTLNDILEILKRQKEAIETNTRAIQMIVKRLDTHEDVLQKLPELISNTKATNPNPGTHSQNKPNLLQVISNPAVIQLLRELGILGGSDPLQKLFYKWVASQLKVGYFINKKILNKVAEKIDVEKLLEEEEE